MWLRVLQASKRSLAVYQPVRSLPLFLSTPLCARVSLPIANNHPFGQAPDFSRLFIARKPFRGKTSIKLVPSERYEALVFRLLWHFPPPRSPRFFPSAPPSVNRERQLVRAFTHDFKIKRKIIYTGRRLGSDRADPVLIPARILGTFDMQSAKSKSQMALVSSRQLSDNLIV